MKKHFQFITKNNGFILLHVLFVISLLFILLSSAVAAYRNEVYITHRQMEQLKVETLFQMAREEYKNDLENADEPPEDVNYDFPHGQVHVTIVQVEETYLKLHFVIRFPDTGFYFPINHLYVYDE